MISLNASESQWKRWRKWLDDNPGAAAPIQFSLRYDSSVTHIVLDSGVTRESLEVFVKRKNNGRAVPFTLLAANHRIVKTSFITDSIRAHALADIDATKYAFAPPAPVQQVLTSSSSKNNVTIISPHSDRVVNNGNSFLCAREAASSSAQPKGLPVNLQIAEQLDQLAEYLQLEDGSGVSQFRGSAYRRTAKMLRNLLGEVSLDNLHLHFEKGSSQRDHVENYLRTGACELLELKKKDKKLQAMVQLQKIWGVGPWTAKKLVAVHDISSIDDLREKVKGNPAILDPQQHIGLNRLDDLQHRIPRDEIAEIFSIIRAEAQDIEPGVEAQVCGSYRRGAPSCGDIDILFVPPEGTPYLFNFLNKLVERLGSRGIGLLTDHLSLPDSFRDYSNKSRSQPKNKQRPAAHSAGSDYEDDCEGGDKSVQSYMGVCRLHRPGSIHRRIDLKIFTRKMYPFALLYFTGSGYFNRSMRRLAGCLDMRLSEQSLYKCGYSPSVRGKKRKKVPLPDGNLFTTHFFLTFFLMQPHLQAKSTANLKRRFSMH